MWRGGQVEISTTSPWSWILSSYPQNSRLSVLVLGWQIPRKFQDNTIFCLLVYDTFCTEPLWAIIGADFVGAIAPTGKNPWGSVPTDCLPHTTRRPHRDNRKFGYLLPELKKLLCIVFTIPVTCTTERSFSALRRLKTFLPTTHNGTTKTEQCCLAKRQQRSGHAVELRWTCRSFRFPL